MTPPPATLVWAPHPILADAGRRIHRAEFLPGESIAAFLERHEVRPRGPCVLTVNGMRLPRAMWAKTFPKPGTLITVRATVEGGGGGGKSPLATVLQLALMVAAPGIGNAVAGAFGMTGSIGFSIFGQAVSIGWGQIIGGAISVLGGLLINNVLAPPPRPQLTQAAGGQWDTPSPTYSLTGGANRARPFETLPLVIGKHRVFPDSGARTYNEFEGDDQYLYEVYHFGLSDVVLSDFRIGATPLSAFDDITIEESGPDGRLTLFPGNVDSTAGGSLTADAGWIQRTSAPNATALAIDLAGSLYHMGQFGMEPLQVIHELEYRAVGSGAWLPFWNGNAQLSIVSSSRKPIRKTYKIPVPEGQYEVRVRRVTGEHADPAKVSQLDWTVLRTYQPDTADYTGQKRVALKARATGQLSGRLAEFNAIASGRCEAWDGNAWTLAETSNPAWWVRWLAKGKTIGGRRAFGAILPDARIDDESLKAFGAWCDRKDLEVNAIFDRPVSSGELLNTIARLGRGQCTWAPGKLAVVWDAPPEDEPIVAVFGMGNIRAGSFSVEYTSERLADEVGVRFVDRDRDYQQDTVYAVVPGVENPVTRAEVELLGCTIRDQAGREANLLAANQSYRARRIKFDTDMEGLVATRGRAIMVSHDLTSWGASGRLLPGSSATVLKLDRKVSYSSGAPYVLVRLPNNSLVTVPVQSFAGESDTLSLAQPLPQDPGNDPDGRPELDYLYFFDPTPTPGKRLKVIDHEPVDENTVRLVCFDDEDGYYLREEASYQSNPATGGADLPTLTGLEVTEELVPAGAGYAVRLTLTWDVTGPYAFATVRSAVGGENLALQGSTASRRFELLVPDSGTCELEVTAYGTGGRWQASGRISRTHEILGKEQPPPDVPWAYLSGDVFQFGSVAAADLLGYEIRYRPGIHGPEGVNSASLLHEGVLTSSPYRMERRPTGQNTFFVRAVDTSLNYSAVPAVVVAEIGDPIVANLVESFDFAAAGWPGELTNGSIDAGELVADDTGGLFWGPDGASFWGQDSAPFWADVNYLEMTYVCSCTITAAGDGALMTIGHAVDGLPWSIEYRLAGPGLFWDPDDGAPFWEDDAATFWDAPPGFAPWPGSLVATNDTYDFRVTTGFGTTQGVISEFEVRVDMPDIVERFNNLAIAAPDGTRLPITRTYRQIKNVQLTLQADGGSAVRARVMDKDHELGPLVQTSDVTLAVVAGTVDAVIQGY